MRRLFGISSTPDVEVVSLAVPLVRIIRFRVVFETVDDGIVVHVRAKKKFGRIDVVAEKRLAVIRLVVLILIEVGDEVLVLVEAREHLPVGELILVWKQGTQIYGAALPVRKAILVVVIVDELVEIVLLVFVIDEALGVGDEHRRRVPRLDAEEAPRNRRRDM